MRTRWGDPDTVLVAGSVGVPQRPGAVRMIDWLVAIAARARRYGSVCTGGRSCSARQACSRAGTVTTHWQYASLLAERFPEGLVEGDRVFIRDGEMITSAGSSAAIDLGLSLVEEDLGREVALYVARRLVVFLKRPGDQSQFSVHLAVQAIDRSRLHSVQQFVLNHPAADLSVTALAKIAAMSPRNFTRVFSQEIGISPSEYVDLTRIDVARFLLEGSRLPIESIASEKWVWIGARDAPRLRRACGRDAVRLPRSLPDLRHRRKEQFVRKRLTVVLKPPRLWVARFWAAIHAPCHGKNQKPPAVGLHQAR